MTVFSFHEAMEAAAALPMAPIRDQWLKSVVDTIVYDLNQCQRKEPSELTDRERLSLYLAAGHALDDEFHGIRAKYPFGIAKINGKFIVTAGRVR